MTMALNPLDTHQTLSSGLRLHLNSNPDALRHFRDVGNDPNLASLCLQIIQGIQGDAQRLRIKAAKAFVNE